MRSFSVSGLVPKSILAAFAATMLAGCSSSLERFNQAYNNPSDADPVYTASVPETATIKKKAKSKAFVEESYDDTIIEETPLKRAAIPGRKQQVDYASAYKKPSYKKPKLVASEEESYSDSYVEPVTAKPTTRKYIEEDVAVASPKAVNGKVRVDQGMTMYSIARANGVNVDDLAQHNGMSEPYTLMVGQTLRMPGAAPAVVAKKKSAPIVEQDVADVAEPVAKKKVKSVSAGTHTVGNGETLYSLGRKYGVSPFVIADANGFSSDQSLSIGQTIKIPGATQKLAAKKAPVEEVVAKLEPVEEDVAEIEKAPVKNLKKKKATLSLSEEEDQQAKADTAGEEAIGEAPKKTAEAKPKKKDEAKVVEKVAEAAPVPAAGFNLRWPVKGKVISNFGNKPNGLKNEGINIAVPEGTDIRAADGGVVAYAGNELKGYGNLILIRHQGGYVTAYAHAKALNVKRGDTVKRGDLIAKAGQTGAVSSPQLHFEVRKGATALDPLKYISSATASN